MNLESDTSRPKLTFLTQWFDPEPALKGQAFAEALAERGFDVEVVTGFPNYPGGKLYKGYRIRPISRSTAGQVAVTRLALYPSHDKSRVGRTLNYLSFFASSLFYLLFMARRSDVILAYHPPATVTLSAAIAGKLRRIPVAVDIQDMWPDTLRATGMISNTWILAAIGKVCAWTYRHVDRIIVLSHGFAELLRQRSIPAEKVTVIHNWADETAAGTNGRADPVALGKDAEFHILFAGNMGAAQGLEMVLEAAALVAGNSPRIVFDFLGSGIELNDLVRKAKDMKLDNVRFLPRVPPEEVGPYLAAADGLLVHLRNDPLFSITVPSKTQTYLAAGRPVVMAVAGDAADLIRQSGGGIVVEPENPAELARAVTDLARMSTEERTEMARRAKAFYFRELSFDHGVSRFVRVLSDLVAKKTAVQAPVGDGKTGFNPPV
jgi:glycosyltransferase involved in cell wall biosynthesis